MKQIVFLLLTSLLIASCSDTDDDIPDKELEGKWVLTNASCFCGFGDNPDFSGHKLNFEGNNLTIENSGEFEFLVNGDGTYTRDADTITLKNGRQYMYAVKDAMLELTFVDEPGIADDELFLEYKRG